MADFRSSLARAIALTLGLSVGLAACTKPLPKAAPDVATTKAAPVAPSGGPWTSQLDATSPLVGMVWSPRTRAAVSREELAKAVEGADFVLLGERHDNVDHHRLQAELLTIAATSPKRPVVAWEMFDAEKQGELDAYVSAHPKDAAGLGAALGWATSGWPAWESYLPIAQVALDRGLRLVAANFSRKLAKGLVFRGPSALPEGSLARLGLDVPLAPPLEASLKQELADAHCGHLPATHTDAMVLAQRARDATLAENVLAAAGKDGRAVLIAGAGHVRTDRGVGALLAQKRSGAKIVSLAFVEVERAQEDPRAYAARYHAEELPFDFVWFTPRASDDDPCAAMQPKGPSAAGGDKSRPALGARLIFEGPYAPGAYPYPPEGAQRRAAIAELATWNEGGRGPDEKWHPQPRVVIGEPVSLGSGDTKSKGKKKSKTASTKSTGSSWDTSGAMRALRRYGYVGVRRCFDAALRETPDLDGRTVVEIEVDGSGHIVRSRASSSRAPDPRKHQTAMASGAVRSCIADALRSVTVPPARGKRIHARVSVDVWPGDVPLPSPEPSAAPGSLPPAAFTTSLSAAREPIQACFEALDKRRPTTWGRLALRLDADPDGALHATQVESTFPDAEAVACVTKAIEGQRLVAHPTPSRSTFALRWKPATKDGIPPPPADPAAEPEAPAETASSQAELR